MGNVCGCVRADKEEQCLDPAKAPLSPAKHSPGRKFLRKKSGKKQNEDEKGPEKTDRNERKIQGRNFIERPTHSRELALSKSVIQKAVIDRTDLPVSTEVAVALLKEKLLSEASCGSFLVEDVCSNNRKVSKFEEKERQFTEGLKRSPEKDSSTSGTQEQEYSYNGNPRELIFQKNSEGLHFENKSSSNSVLNKQCEEKTLHWAPSRSTGAIQEWKKSERLHPCDLQNQSYPQQGFPNSGSLPFSVENATFSIFPSKSKVNML